MSRVLVTPGMLATGDWPLREVLTSAGLDILYPSDPLSLFQTPKLIAALEGVSAIVASVEPFTREVLTAAKSLRVIARVGVGYDAVDVQAATDLGIAVTITPGTNEHSVAELAISMMTAIYRGFPARDRVVRAGQWSRQILPRLAGRTVGLVGLGRIGRAVVSRAIGLGLHVVAYDPFADQEWCKAAGVKLLSFEELLRTSDIVSLHCPATVETFNLINAGTIALMKPNAVLINTSRGNLVDEDALVEALKSGRLFAAGLDVFKVEPPPADHPLFALENVLLSPHTGGLDTDSIRDMSTMAAQCVADLATGVWPEKCVVNKEVKATWKW